MKTRIIILFASLLLTSVMCLGQSASKDSAQISKTPYTPLVVAKVAMKGVTKGISTTTILTSREDSLYRISLYMIPTATDGNANLSATFGYTDDAGPESQLILTLADHPGCNTQQLPTYNCNAVLMAYNKAGSPLTFSTGISENAGLVYDVFFTVERVE